MKVSNEDSVAVYTVSGSSSKQLPEWLSQQKKKALKKDPEWANRVTLLQDFEFEEASTCVAVSPDQEWVISTGTYKPQIHVHSLEQLSLSWSRHTTSLTQSLVILSQDYSKSLYLQDDRSIELHTPAGLHLALRIPRYGRNLVYDTFATEALVPSVGLGSDGTGEVFRLNLELGRFMQSYQVDVGSDDQVEERGLQGSIDVGAVNTAAIAGDSHGLLAFGTTLGTTEFFDPRAKTRVAALQAHDGEITALDFSSTGNSIATGSSNGIVQLYDLRRPRPLLTRDQGFGLPIKKLIHITTSSHEKKLLSMDKKIIKIFEEGSGENWVNVEPNQDLNDVAWIEGTGMLLTANEGPQQHAFHIPRLGPAPKFCSFLDNMVEEMAEEVSTETYSNFKFLTVAELRSLSLDHLVGKTNLLRPYMHGYFVASKLYDQARLIANPYVWEEERIKRVQNKIEKERSSKIRGTKKVKVNQKLVDKLLKKQEKRETVDTEAGILGDDRFKAMFEDEDFKVDENSKEFRLLNPSTVVEGQDTTAVASTAADAEFDSSDDEQNAIRKNTILKSRADRKSKADVVMRVSSSARGSNHARDTALGSRTHKAARVDKIQRGAAAGEKSVTFIPESNKKKQQPETPATTNRKDARRSASANTFRRMG